MLFAVFGFGLVVSHYALAYIVIAFLVLAWMASYVRKSKPLASMNMIIFFIVLTFSWYIYVSSAQSFNVLVMSVRDIGSNFINDFFDPQSRGESVLANTGVGVVSSFYHTIEDTCTMS